MSKFSSNYRLDKQNITRLPNKHSHKSREKMGVHVKVVKDQLDFISFSCVSFKQIAIKKKEIIKQV